MNAVAYYRTSSLSNVEGDSQERQQTAIRAYAGRNGLEILAEYYDGGVSGTVPVDCRPEFCRMLEERLADTILVETASRFARDLIVQEVGHMMLKEKSICLIAVDDPDAYTEDTPTAVFVRQLMGAVAQFEKAMSVKRMRSGLDRVARENGRRMEGNHGFKVTYPAAPGLAAHLQQLNSGKLSLRTIAQMLAEEGYTRENGEPFHPGTVARWVS